jgi:Rhodanese-like domain
MQRATAARLPRVLMGLLVLIAGYVPTVLANPQDYPQFAQHKVDDDIPIAFITVDEVKQHLDAGTQQLIVDVRDRAAYEKAHLPGAVLIPLRDFPYRAVEVPRDIPVVLY